MERFGGRPALRPQLLTELGDCPPGIVGTKGETPLCGEEDDLGFSLLLSARSVLESAIKPFRQSIPFKKSGKLKLHLIFNIHSFS